MVPIYLMMAVWVAAFSLMLWGTWLALNRISTPPPHTDAPFGLFPVSILKPLKGADAGLEENLESFFTLDYPDYELLFSVEDGRDPACQTVRALIAKYPNVKAQLIVAKIEIGPNPKINNLVFSYGRARHDWILISDSNVRVTPDYLKRMVAHIDPSVGLITAIVAGRNYEGVGGHLEAVCLNTYYARGMHLAAAVGRPAALGKSMLFRRSVARRFGGIGMLARYLAEDYMAGEAMRALGLQVRIMGDPVMQHIGSYDFKAFWDRHVRWGRIRKSNAPLAFIVEGPLGTMVSGILGAIAFNQLFGLQLSQFMLMHLSAWSFCDLLLIRRLADPNGQERVDFKIALAWFLRELMAVPMWIYIASGNTVNWRGRKITLEAGGTIKAS